MQLSLPFDREPEGPCQSAVNDDESTALRPCTCPSQQAGSPGEDAGLPRGQVPELGLSDESTVHEQVSAPQDLQQVMDLINDDLGKLATDMRSAIRTLARGIGQKPNNISADPATLRRLVFDAAPARLGIRPKTWANARSLTLKALALSGVEVMPGRDTGGPNPQWRASLDLVPDKGDQHALSRFASYCSKRGVPLNAVAEQDFADFSRDLREVSLVRNPARVICSTVDAWNRVAASLPDWPQLTITRPVDTRRYVLPPETFPSSFHDDREAYLSQGWNADVFSDDHRKPLRPDTIMQQRKLINQLASALVLSGRPSADVTSLAVLVEPANARAELTWLRERNGGQFSQGIANQANLLHMLAVGWVRNQEHAEILKGYAKRHRDPVKRGAITPKNRERLRQFDLDQNVQALVLLPLKILEQANAAKVPTEEQAREILFALAVEILLVAPLRIKNLVGLQVDKHLPEVRRGRQSTRHIVIPNFATKSGAPLEMELPRTSQQLLRIFEERYRSLLVKEGSTYLFPGKSRSSRNPSQFGSSLSAFILSQTGLVMNPHLFRHTAAKLHLRAHPQQIEVVRLFLSHASSETTEKFYAELKSDHAFRSWDATIAALRGIGEGMAKRPRGPKGPETRT